MTSTDAPAQTTARQIQQLVRGAGAQLAGKKRGPDRRVRRSSLDVDDRRARAVWHSINGGSRAGGLRWRDAVMKTAEEYDLVGKQTGRWGPLGPHTLRVLKELLQLVDFASGRLDPSYDCLASRTGFAKSTIASALRKLQAHRFLDWVRRTRVVDGEAGPERKQTSNAYFFSFGGLPKRVLQRFRDLLGRAERRAAGDRTEAPCPVLARNPALAAVIARMQAHFDAGEQAEGPE